MTTSAPLLPNIRGRPQMRWTASTRSSREVSITWSAPIAVSFSSFQAALPVATTSAPIDFASWMQPVPTPPAAPRIRTFSPAFTFPRVFIMR
jgi:hypothetical protein